MVRSVALVFAVACAVSACDAVVDPPVDSAVPGFTAEVSGGLERSLQGEASTSTLGGTGVSVAVDGRGTVTALLLTAEGSADRFALVGVTDGPLVPGTYAIAGLGSRLGPGDFYGVYSFPLDGGERPTTSVAIGREGTVTITRADDAEIAGSFAFTAGAVTGHNDGDPEVGDLALEGTFTVDVREIERGGGR